MRFSRRYACGVPQSSCCGSQITTNSGSTSGHTTPQEAFNCYSKYLIKEGFVQVGSREFKSPKDGTIHILTKKCRFGGIMRPGKSDKTQSSKRFVPYCGRHPKAGLFISLSLLASFLIGCSGPRVEVPAGHYAKIMAGGGFQKGVITEAKSLTLPAEWYTSPRLYLCESGDNGIKESMEIYLPKDKLKLSVDIRGTLTISTKEDKIDLLFHKIAPDTTTNSNIMRIDFDKVYAIYGLPVLRTTTREVLVKYTIMEILDNLKNISNELEKEIRKDLANSPIEVISISLSDIKPPSVITDAQELNKKREIEVEKAEADKMVDLKKAEGKLIMAKKDQEIDLLEAETQVLVEKKLSESVTPAFIQQRMLKILDKAASNGNLIIISEEVLQNPAMLFNLQGKILKKQEENKAKAEK